MKINTKLKYYLCVGVAIIPVIGIVLNSSILDDIILLDLLSGFSVKTAYISVGSIFIAYLLYRLIYTEKKDQRRLIKVSAINFLVNIAHLSLLILGGLYLTNVLDIEISSSTGIIISIAFLVTSVSIMMFEFDLYQTRKNFIVKNQIEKANKKAITSSILLHALILITLATLATTSETVRNDALIGSSLLIWDSFYVTLLQPLIIPKITTQDSK